jgi:arginase family enzyme
MQPALPERVAILGVRYDGSSSYLMGSADAPPMIRQALWSDEFSPVADATGLTASASAKLVKELAGRMLVENT